MKIINENTRVTCFSCGCVYEFDAHDIKKEPFTEWGFPLKRRYMYYYVRCPICSTKHSLHTEFIGYS